MGVKKLVGMMVLAAALTAPLFTMSASTGASGSTTTACVNPYPVSQCPPPTVALTTVPTVGTTSPTVRPSVGATAASQGGSALALTGADIGILVVIGAVIIMVGVLLVRLARRRA